MVRLTSRYAMDARQQCQGVILCLDEWRAILAELEELDDLRAYDTARLGSQEAVPLEQAVREIGEGNAG